MKPSAETVKVSHFPAPACGGRRLRSTASNLRTTLLVPLASLDSPNQGRRVACGSADLGSLAAGGYFLQEFPTGIGCPDHAVECGLGQDGQPQGCHCSASPLGIQGQRGIRHGAADFGKRRNQVRNSETNTFAGRGFERGIDLFRAEINKCHADDFQFVRL